MRSYDENIIPDDEEIFYDGILYVISRVRYVEGGVEKSKHNIDVKVLTAPYDAPISLADIREKYPYVRKVIFDDALRGAVYNYKNHCDGEGWEEVGITKGYA